MEYRLFFYDGVNHLMQAHEFVADDDAQAAKMAEGWREGRKMELWQRSRMVRCWDFPKCPKPGCGS